MNRSSSADGESDNTWCRKNLACLLDYLQRLIDAVVANLDGFNDFDFAAHNLLYYQRAGSIAQKVPNRIAPNYKMEVEDKETSSRHLKIRCTCVPYLAILCLLLHCQCSLLLKMRHWWTCLWRSPGSPGRTTGYGRLKRMKLMEVDEMYDIDSLVDLYNLPHRYATVNLFVVSEYLCLKQT